MQDTIEVNNYGSRFRDHWKVREGALVSTSLPKSTGVTIARVTAGANYGLVQPVPAQDGFALSLELKSFERGELWLDGRKCRQDRLWENYSVFYDLRHDVEAYLEDPFDFIQFHVPRIFLDELAGNHGVSPIGDLNFQTGIGVEDPIIASLSKIILPALDRSHEVSLLFVDHITMALCAHIGQRYGGGFAPFEADRGGLAPRQLRRAQELIDSSLSGDISMSEIAQQCMLTPSYFSRQFKRSTGLTPVQWLQSRRVEKAKALLGNPKLSLSDIAAACGFADQSHFTRVFSQLTGSTPKAWRKQNSL
jgi:AraC family transcriptional regulator